MKHTPEIKTYGEAIEIWKRNGLMLPEMPLDESIFPDARRLLEMESIKSDLLEACRSLIDMITDNRLHGLEVNRACEAIAKAERREEK